MNAMDGNPADPVQDSGQGRWSRLVAGLQPRWLTGGVTTIRNQHTTNWRTVAGSVVAFTSGGVVEVRFPDRPAQRVGPEEALCVADGILHRIDLVSPEAVSSWCHLELALPIAVDVTLVHQPALVFRGETAQDIGRINRALIQVATSQTVPGILARQALLWNLAQLVLQDSTCPVSSRLDQLDRLRPAMDRMRADLHRDLPVAVLARTVDLSVSQFHACFKLALGCSPITWMRRLRLSEAQRLLLTTSDPIQRIAALCGYSDPYHFSRLFRRHAGRSPSRWRQGIF